MKTLIVGSGSELNEELMNKHCSWADFVIAADGGLMHLKKAGHTPNALLGDFDSIPDAILHDIKVRKDVEIIKFPTNKDYTDMELAIDFAIERGASHIAILGASGTRLDHTTANIHLLYKLVKNNIKGYIEDNHNKVYLIDDSITIDKQENNKVSLLPMFPFAKGVTTKGLSYELNNDNLVFGTGLGISNEFSDDKAYISIKEGLLLVFVSKD